jgi:hypothetical protein
VLHLGLKLEWGLAIPVGYPSGGYPTKEARCVHSGKKIERQFCIYASAHGIVLNVEVRNVDSRKN